MYLQSGNETDSHKGNEPFMTRPDAEGEARCTACGSPDTSRDPFYYEWRDRRFWIHRCDLCSHQFVFPSITAEEQADIYDDSYFERGGDWVAGVFDASYQDAEADLREEADEILGLLGEKSGRLLDVGCAGGVFLDVARSVGFEVQGLEINTTMAEYARERFGLDVVNSPIENVPADQWQQAFDVCTMLDCLEHIPDPLDAVSKVGQWVRPGGKLLIRGPLSNSGLARAKEALRRLAGLNKQLPGYPLDANMFNMRSMEAMLSEAGFGDVRWWATKDFANLVATKR